MTEQACPSCRAIVPVEPGYATWCEQCGWNLRPHEPPAAASPWSGVYSRIGARLGEQLLVEVQQPNAQRAHYTPSIILALILAGAVHAVTAAFAALGVLSLLAARSQHAAIFGAGIASFGGRYGEQPQGRMGACRRL